MIGQLLAIVPDGTSIPWGAIFGGTCGIAVAVIHTRSRERTLRLKHQQTMELRRYDHDHAIGEAQRLRDKLTKKGFSPEDSDVDGED